jgi:hypothetical protein
VSPGEASEPGSGADASAAAPSFPIGGPTSSAWREEMLTKVKELSGLASWLEANPDGKHQPGELRKAIAEHLRAAHDTAAGTAAAKAGLGFWGRWKAGLGGSSFERALGNIDAVEVSLLRLAPEHYLRGQLPSLRAHVNRFLPKDDPRRMRVDDLALEMAQHHEGDRLRSEDRDSLVAAYHAANSQRRRDLIRLRSFRNWVVVATIALFLAAGGLALLGLAHKDWIPVCFFPEEKQTFVCPRTEQVGVGDPATVDIDQLVAETATRQDLLLVSIVGLFAAVVAAAGGLRNARGTSTPYGLPVALAMLKLPTGALTAVIGLLLMRGGFVPGLSALDSSAQIIAWAIVFGYAQQAVTGLIDNQAKGILDDVGGRGASGDRGA